MSNKEAKLKEPMIRDSLGKNEYLFSIIKSLNDYYEGHHSSYANKVEMAEAIFEGLSPFLKVSEKDLTRVQLDDKLRAMIRRSFSSSIVY